MLEAKHTPAPWMVSENERKALAIFPANDKGRPRALCSLAFVQSWNDTSDDMANARLIAAAPELLEALEELLAADEAYEWAKDDSQEKIDTALVWSKAQDKALAAIAKATGAV